VIKGIVVERPKQALAPNGCHWSVRTTFETATRAVSCNRVVPCQAIHGRAGPLAVEGVSVVAEAVGLR